MGSVAGCAQRSAVTSGEFPYEERLSLAAAYRRSGDADRAMRIIEDAVKNNPDRPEAYAILGDIEYAKGDLQKASLHYHSSLDAGGNDPVMLNNLAWVETSLGNHGAALSLIEKAIRTGPSPLYSFLDTRARILKAMGNYKDALASARHALSLTPLQDETMRGNLGALVVEITKLLKGDGR